MAKITTNLFCIQMLSTCPFSVFVFFIFQTTPEKNCGKNQKFPLSLIINVVVTATRQTSDLNFRFRACFEQGVP